MFWICDESSVDNTSVFGILLGSASTESSLSFFGFVFPAGKKMDKKKSEGDTAGTADPNWLKGDSMNHNIMGYRKKGLGGLRGWRESRESELSRWLVLKDFWASLCWQQAAHGYFSSALVCLFPLPLSLTYLTVSMLTHELSHHMKREWTAVWLLSGRLGSAHLQSYSMCFVFSCPFLPTTCFPVLIKVLAEGQNWRTPYGEQFPPLLSCLILHSPNKWNVLHRTPSF